jgi:hypothetical protein
LSNLRDAAAVAAPATARVVRDITTLKTLEQQGHVEAGELLVRARALSHGASKGELL